LTRTSIFIHRRQPSASLAQRNRAQVEPPEERFRAMKKKCLTIRFLFA